MEPTAAARESPGQGAVPSRSTPISATATALKSQSKASPSSLNGKKNWTESIRKAIQGHEKGSYSAPKPDPVGDHITGIMNTHSLFNSLEDQVEEKEFYPILSSHNFRKWRQGFIEGKILYLPVTILATVKHFLFARVSLIRQTLRLLGLLLAVSIGLSVYLSHLAIVYTAQTILLYGWLLCAFIIDVQELKWLCPAFVSTFWDALVQSFDWIDGDRLKRYRLSGREWNDDRFCWKDGMASKSRQESLSKCPPPRSIDPDETAQRSVETLQHLAAINYCSGLLQKEVLHKSDKKRNKMKQSASKVKLKDNRQKHSINTHATPSDHSNVVLLATADGNFIEELPPDDASNISLTGPSIDDKYDIISQEYPSSPPLSPRSASVNSQMGCDMNWLDVGARIGVQILNSEHVQKAITSQDTAERIKGLSSKMDLEDPFFDSAENLALSNDAATSSIIPCPFSEHRTTISPQRPIHAMWTSPGAEIRRTPSMSSMSEAGNASITNDIVISPPRRSTRNLEDGYPHLPRSPPSNGNLRQRSNDQKETSLITDLNGAKKSAYLDYHNQQLATPNMGLLLQNNDDEADNSYPSDPSERHGSARPPQIERKCQNSLLLKLSPKLSANARPRLLPGVKVVVPIFPIQPTTCRSLKRKTNAHPLAMQMGTVVDSKRIYVRSDKLRSTSSRGFHTNCLSVTAKLDKSFLRDGEFAEVSFRVMDEWGPRYMPRHSKFPIGECVATSFGVGVLVGWRVEDDCHVVRSLWQSKGPGKAHAYLNRDSIFGIVEASVGFPVETKLGYGAVKAYVHGGSTFQNGRYFVHIKEEGLRQGQVLEFNRSDIISCHGPSFIPIIEYIREAAQYQMQVDNYEVAKRKRKLESEDHLWKNWSNGFETIWLSFLKAMEENSGFDEGFSAFVSSAITFLDRLDGTKTEPSADDSLPSDEQDTNGKDKVACADDTVHNDQSIMALNESASETASEAQDFWILNDLFGGIFYGKKGESTKDNQAIDPTVETFETALANKECEVRDRNYQVTFAIIQAFMRTVSIARAASVDSPNFSMALSIVYEFLLFVKTVVKVQQKNVSPVSVAIWKRTIAEVVSTFGPAKERLGKIGHGIKDRLERQGNKAKVRILRFVDVVLVDELLLEALEKSDWDQCFERLEQATVKSRIIDADSREYYHKCAMFIIDHLAPSTSGTSAAARNQQKLARFAKAMKWMAYPRRSFLGFLKSDDVLDLVERILVRVFRKETKASRMLSIHAANFHSLRHLRMLRNFTIYGKLWIPLLDAADSEFVWAVSRMPENTKGLMTPLSKLFSLCVTQFHTIGEGDLTAGWLDFLMTEEAATLINAVGTDLTLGLEAFCKDVKEVMIVLPYYSTIDEDILNLMDEVDLDEFIKEASGAMEDQQRLHTFLKEKSTTAIERFLDYLPKMSIPVEQRELNDGWIITCRGEHGGHLTLSEVGLKRENLICQVLGNENFFAPFGDEIDDKSESSTALSSRVPIDHETSILDDIRELLLQAQRNGCWQDGAGGVGQLPSDPHVRSVFNDLHISGVLNCGIELWRSLEIDDDELMEIAIRDVSFQIQLHGEREQDLSTGNLPVHNRKSDSSGEGASDNIAGVLPGQRVKSSLELDPFENISKRFNPRKDPTVLYVEMKNLTLHLDNFQFRIEQEEKKSIFDPVFEGVGALAVRDVSIKLRVECRKERTTKMGYELTVPILQLVDLDVKLAKVKFKVKDTGADWLLNKVVKGFTDSITAIVETNMKEQVLSQIQSALKNLNSYFEVNPNLLLNLLGITMDDLEENIVWV